MQARKFHIGCNYYFFFNSLEFRYFNINANDYNTRLNFKYSKENLFQYTHQYIKFLNCIKLIKNFNINNLQWQKQF